MAQIRRLRPFIDKEQNNGTGHRSGTVAGGTTTTKEKKSHDNESQTTPETTKFDRHQQVGH